MKEKISFTIDRDLKRHFKRQRVMHGLANDSQFAEWIFRQVLYKPKALLKIKAKEYASKLYFIQEKLNDLNEIEQEVLIEEKEKETGLVDY